MITEHHAMHSVLSEFGAQEAVTGIGWDRPDGVGRVDVADVEFQLVRVFGVVSNLFLQNFADVIEYLVS